MRTQKLTAAPLFEALEGSQRILLAGAGGGFDLYSALPLFFALKDLGRAVFLANSSFSALSTFDAPSIHEGCLEIQADSKTPTVYWNFELNSVFERCLYKDRIYMRNLNADNSHRPPAKP